jgi:hypothetical protein
LICPTKDSGLISYGSTPDDVTVEYWMLPKTFAGRTIYTFDSNHNLSQIRKFDSLSQLVVTASVERRSGGGFYDVVLEFIENGHSTSKLCDPVDPQLPSFSIWRLYLAKYNRR